jgi:putative glycosyltransferase (TIGR04348 family)
MAILILSPHAPVSRAGNDCTAAQWRDLLESAGHPATVIHHYHGEPAAILIAIHGRKSHHAITAFRHLHPDAKIVLALSGTDIYPSPDPATLVSIDLADHLIALQHRALLQIPPHARHKATVIVQSAEVLAPHMPPPPNTFPVCVIGHIRPVKNPLLAAQAARLLPTTSQIHIRLAGGVLDPELGDLVAAEHLANPRFSWLGELDARATARLIASSQLLVMSSHQEGGARVIGEAIAHGTPVLSTNMEAAVGLLGDSYPGLFPVDDAPALAQLLSRAETDPAFLAQLQDLTTQLAPQFHPDAERAALASLITSLVSSP